MCGHESQFRREYGSRETQRQEQSGKDPKTTKKVEGTKSEETSGVQPAGAH